MAETVSMGSLCFNGQAQAVGGEYNDERLSIGPTVPGKAIQWVKANNLLIADRVICTNVSWAQLDACGLVFGIPVQIDGNMYLCRCLRVGSKESVPNEWDDALTATDESNDLWHWSNEFFWGQEPAHSSYRAVRGDCSARHWDYITAATRSVGFGFRPVLEPLGSEPWNPYVLIGKTIRLYGTRGVPLEGCLLDVDDYDFTLTPVTGTPTDCLWASKAGDNLIVSRDSVLWAKEA